MPAHSATATSPILTLQFGMSQPGSSRREFLRTVGVTSAALMAPLPLAAAGASERQARFGSTSTGGAHIAAPRGLALAPNDFLFESGLTYLQTGSLGPTPRPVLEKALGAWTTLESNPAAQGYGPLEHALEEVRAKAAGFLGCRTEEMILTNCTTEGMNWIAQGLGLAAGDRVLTTDQEHPGGRVCWDYAVRKFGIGLDVVPIAPGETDTQAIVLRFLRAITPKTKVLSFSHLLSSTGLRMPVAELSQLAREHGCLAVVDGAQAVGAIAVDLKALGCHAYATSGHKWLLAPKGTGLLYLSEELGARIDPIALQSGRAGYSASSGVSSIPSVVGLGAAIDYLTTIGMAKVEAHNLALRERLHGALAAIPQLSIVSGGAGPTASPLLSYRLPDAVKSGDLHARLRTRHHVEVKVVPGNWFNGQRISTHLFNTEQDIDALLRALTAELR